jgi:predicted alpha/beta hydrolase
MRVDVGFGNPVIPKMDTNQYPSMLSNDKKNPLPEPKVLMYSPYSMMAEKLHAIAQFGIYNTRIRDYYDLYFLSTNMELEQNTLAEAIIETFEKQERELPENISGLSDEFVKEKKQDWERYSKNKELSLKVPELGKVIEEIKKTIIPALDLAKKKQNDNLHFSK